MIIDLYGTSMGLGLTSSTFATKLDEVGLKLTIAYLFFGEDMVQVQIKDRKETRHQRSFTFGIQHQDQGLVNVPFWVYWTSPYSNHYRPYT